MKDESLKTEVVNDKEIQFEGEITSLSAAARIIEQRKGSRRNAFAGPRHWLYKDKTLSELRNEMENE